MKKPAWEYWLTEDGLLLLRSWARCDLSAEEIAARMGISVQTLNRWKKEHPPICEALSRDGGLIDFEVEEALQKLCVGYTVKVNAPMKVKRVEYDSATGKKLREWEEVVDTVKEDHVPASVPAQRFWLMNRLSGRWREHDEERGEDEGGIIVLPARDSEEKADEERQP